MWVWCLTLPTLHAARPGLATRRSQTKAGRQRAVRSRRTHARCLERGWPSHTRAAHAYRGHNGVKSAISSLQSMVRWHAPLGASCPPPWHARTHSSHHAHTRTVANVDRSFCGFGSASGGQRLARTWWSTCLGTSPTPRTRWCGTGACPRCWTSWQPRWQSAASPRTRSVAAMLSPLHERSYAWKGSRFAYSRAGGVRAQVAVVVGGCGWWGGRNGGVVVGWWWGPVRTSAKLLTRRTARANKHTMHRATGAGWS